MAIASQRHLFDIPDDVAYLNCAYMAPLMHSVMAAGERGVRRKGRPWEIHPPDFYTQSEEARALFARIINAAPDDVALVPSASYGIAAAARNVPLRPGQSIVLLEAQFPSNVYAWRGVAETTGADVITVARPADGAWTDAVLAAVNGRTAIAALPHCHWTDGGLLDLVRIGAHCRQTGTALVLDLTQSAGALPFDVERVRPDFAVAAAYKWLLGPYTSGFLYVAPHRQQGEPLEHNWIARAGSESFAELVNYTDAYQPGARRFDMGERSSFHLLPMVVTALRQVLDWGVADIAATLAARTATIAERAAALGLRSVPAARRAGHFAGLRFAQGVPDGLLGELAAARVYVSVRGDSMRVTPHVYTTDHDIERLFDVLESALPDATAA